MQNSKSKLWNGNVMSNGQLWIDPRGNGKSKTYPTPKPSHGAVRQTSGKLSAYHHGIEQDDEPLEGNKTYLKTPELHSGTPNPDVLNPHHAGRASHVGGLGQAVLDDAARLGQKG